MEAIYVPVLVAWFYWIAIAVVQPILDFAASFGLVI